MVDKERAIAGIQRTLKGLLFTETEVFYFHLENLGVKPDEILDKPEKFAQTIYDIFGKGAPLVERSIISEVARELSVDPKGDLVEMPKSVSRE